MNLEGEGRFADIWKPPYRRRAIMLIVFHVFQAIGFFGFGNWLPALISGQGVSVTHSLMYAFIITLAYPLGRCCSCALPTALKTSGRLLAQRLEQ